MVGDIFRDSQMFHQRLYRYVEGPGNDYLSQTQTARFFDQLVGSGKDPRLQNILQQFFGEEPQSVFRYTFVPFEIEVIEYFSTVLIGDRENRQTDESCNAFLETAKQSWLVSCVEAQRMN